MRAPIFDITGKKQGEAELPVELFGVEPNQTVLSQYLRVYQMRQRSAGAKAKTRSEVTATTAKVWRQKGTGRARHGSRRAPIFIGGGQAHGPKGNQNFKLNLPKKIKQLALTSALSTRVEDVILIEGLSKIKDKTKDLAQALDKIAGKDTKGLLLVLDVPNSSVVKAGANLENLSVTQASRLNPFETLKAKRLLLAKESLDVLASRLNQSSEEAEKDTKKAEKKS